jgi:hypothetical protein
MVSWPYLECGDRFAPCRKETKMRQMNSDSSRDNMSDHNRRDGDDDDDDDNNNDDDFYVTKSRLQEILESLEGEEQGKHKFQSHPPSLSDLALQSCYLRFRPGTKWMIMMNGINEFLATDVQHR